MLVFLLISCVAAAAFFASVQVALFALTPVDLRVATGASPRRIRQVRRLLAQPRDLLVTLIFCDVSAAIMLQNTVARLFGEASSWWITVGVPIVLTLFLGEILPKSLALPYRTRIATRVAPIILTMRQLLQPICRPISRFTSSVTHLIFPYLRPNKELTPEEVAYLVQLSAEGGVVDDKEALWLHNYLALSGHTIRERMHPRDELVFYTVGEPLNKLADCFSQRSEVVICRGDLQNVLGTLSATDYLLHKEDLNHLLDVVQRPFFAPESLPLTSLFTRWLQSTARFCLVVDEYGVISGWFIRDDLYRLILSEPKQESAEPTEPLIVSGKMELQEFYQRFALKLESPHNMSTIAGWITEKLGEIPKKGTTLTHEGFVFQIVEAEPHKIKTLSIKRPIP